MVRPCDFEKHEAHDCNKRKGPCRLGCGEVMWGSDMYEHEATECPQRVALCGLVRSEIVTPCALPSCSVD